MNKAERHEIATRISAIGLSLGLMARTIRRGEPGEHYDHRGDNGTLHYLSTPALVEKLGAMLADIAREIAPKS